MATRGENCNDWPKTVMTGGCITMAFAPDGATGNDDDDDRPWANENEKQLALQENLQ